MRVEAGPVDGRPDVTDRDATRFPHACRASAVDEDRQQPGAQLRASLEAIDAAQARRPRCPGRPPRPPRGRRRSWRRDVAWRHGARETRATKAASSPARRRSRNRASSSTFISVRATRSRRTAVRHLPGDRAKRPAAQAGARRRFAVVRTQRSPRRQRRPAREPIRRASPRRRGRRRTRRRCPRHRSARRGSARRARSWRRPSPCRSASSRTAAAEPTGRPHRADRRSPGV